MTTTDTLATFCVMSGFRAPGGNALSLCVFDVPASSANGLVTCAAAVTVTTYGGPELKTVRVAPGLSCSSFGVLRDCVTIINIVVVGDVLEVVDSRDVCTDSWVCVVSPKLDVDRAGTWVDPILPGLKFELVATFGNQAMPVRPPSSEVTVGVGIVKRDGVLLTDVPGLYSSTSCLFSSFSIWMGGGRRLRFDSIIMNYRAHGEKTKKKRENDRNVVINRSLGANA
ncbi:hypothetical protein B0O99DRAFT_602610 [Bisporella sp. PMI_857]|nr:hypothetical protein B0O99DRAFT_602610 [Bisporella sp. PMI_857]